jgi:crotonobetainyl-CoA:carnitine CoA-transferase CaiB-like acyl-CoA transferase
VDDPQLAATGLISFTPHPTEGRIAVLENPTTWSSGPLPALLPAPNLGEHTDQILSELKLAPDHIARLMDVVAATRAEVRRSAGAPASSNA